MCMCCVCMCIICVCVYLVCVCAAFVVLRYYVYYIVLCCRGDVVCV